MLVFLGELYIKDINWMKGRKGRRPSYKDDPNCYTLYEKFDYAQEFPLKRIQAHDPQYLKYLEPKGHHH